MNEESIPMNSREISVHQNIINGEIYFYATREGQHIQVDEIKKLIPEDLANIFDGRYELGSEEYIKCCEVLGLETFDVSFIIDADDIGRLRRAAHSGNQYEAEVADDLLKLAMVIPNGIAAIGKDYNKNILIESARRRLFHANNKNRFNTEWYNKVFYKLEKILIGGRS